MWKYFGFGAMSKAISPRGEFSQCKGESPFAIDPPRRQGRTASLGFLYSELIRSTLAPYFPSEDSQGHKKMCILGQIPAELREMIFLYALSDEWNGKMPALIKALRPEGHIYEDCMAIWNRMRHTYVLHAKNNWSFLDMTPEAISTIRVLKVMIDENVTLHPLLTWEDMKVVQTRREMSAHDLAITASLATGVTSVTLDCRPTSTNLYYWYPQKFFLFFSGFEHLKYAAVTCPIKPNTSPETGGAGPVERVEDGMVDSQWQADTMRNGIPEANTALGGLAKLDRVYADKFDALGKILHRTFDFREKWVWAAEEGKFLTPVILPDGLKMDR